MWGPKTVWDYAQGLTRSRPWPYEFVGDPREDAASGSDLDELRFELSLREDVIEDLEAKLVDCQDNLAEAEHTE